MLETMPNKQDNQIIKAASLSGGKAPVAADKKRASAFVESMNIRSSRPSFKMSGAWIAALSVAACVAVVLIFTNNGGQKPATLQENSSVHAVKAFVDTTDNAQTDSTSFEIVVE